MRSRPLIALLVAVAAGLLLHAQGTPPPSPLVLLSRDGRRPLPTTLLSGQEMVALDDLATALQLSVREDALAGGVTVSYKGRTVVLSPDQPVASVNGRLVSLPSPLVRSGRRFLVPVEFISRALGPIYDAKLELRKPSRLVLLGDVRVPRITARVEGAGPSTRVILDVAPPATVTAAVEAARILLDVEADAIDISGPVAGAGLVEQVRAGDQPRTVAIVLRSGIGPVRSSTVQSDGGARVTVDITAANASPVAGPAALPPAAAAPPPLPPALGDPAIPKGPVLQTIVLDPGHGGDDTGGKAGARLLEKNVTLDTARQIKAMVEGRLGIRVVLTREDDRAVPLDARAAVANNSKADLFISVHANAAFGPATAGAEVYSLSADADVEQARRDAEADSATLPAVGGGTRRIDVVPWYMAQAHHLDDSASLASILEAALRAQQVPMSAQPLKRAPLRVLVGANMPAALIEMGYLTNDKQARQLLGAEFQNNVVQAVFNAILQFRERLEAQR